MIILVLLSLSITTSYGQNSFPKDTMFKWENLRLIYFGLESGTGLLNNSNIRINNFDKFAKVEFGARIYIKKIGFGWRGGFLLSRDNNAGNTNNIIVTGKFDNRQSSCFLGYLVTSPKYFSIEPAIFYSSNFGLLYYDSLEYGKYTNNQPPEIYRLETYGVGFNSYLNLNSIFPKLNGNPLYIFTQMSFQIPIKDNYLKGHLQSYSLGISLFPFFYNSTHYFDTRRH